MTLTQLSNLFNSIALASGLFKFYHYGWPQDMNINIQNNSDPNASLGSQFPYLLFMPPVISNTVLDSSNYQTYQVELLLTDTYGFNAQQLDYKGDTTLDVENNLCQIGRQFVDYLRQYGNKVNFDVLDYTFDIDPNSGLGDVQSTLNEPYPENCQFATPLINFGIVSINKNFADTFKNT